MNDIANLDDRSVETIRKDLDRTLESRSKRAFKKLIMAAMGSIPWVGSFIQAAMDFRDEETGQLRVNDLQREWFEEHSEQMRHLEETLTQMMERLLQLGNDVFDRVESSEYLALVRKAFRAWDQADTQEKKDLLRKLLANAAAVKICHDDLVRLFIDWINRYHEIHFKVIRCIYQNRGVTRAAIWESIHGEFPREDSAEADLFKLLIFDLTTGYVIRQHRDTTQDGRFIKRAKTRRAGTATMKSAFSDDEPYELTELGSQFVHYTMEEVVPRFPDQTAAV